MRISQRSDAAGGRPGGLLNDVHAILIANLNIIRRPRRVHASVYSLHLTRLFAAAAETAQLVWCCRVAGFNDHIMPN